MLDSLKKRPGSLRWPPRQRFLATEQGKLAVAQYEEAIRACHASGRHDREELEKLQSFWAQSHQVSPQDAAVLSECVAKDRLPKEMLKALEDCGTTLPEIQAAIDRLYTAGLLVPANGGGPLPPPEHFQPA